MNIKNTQPYNDEKQQHGYWKMYWTSGRYWYEGNHINGKRDGLWKFYDVQTQNNNVRLKQFYI